MRKYLGWIALVIAAFVAGIWVGKYWLPKRNRRECGFHQIEKDQQLQTA